MTLDLSQSVASGDGGETDGPPPTDGGGGERRLQHLLRRNVFWCLVALVVASAAGGLAYLRTWPPMAIVQSGSMVPTIQIGDVVVLKHLDGPPKVGEIVVVHVPDSVRARYGYPPVVTHRIVAIAKNGSITTKGDALKTDDPFTTRRDTVTEQVVAILPEAGRIYGFFTSTWGILWLLAGVALLIGGPLLEGHKEREEQERDVALGLQTQLATLAEAIAGQREHPIPSRPLEALETKLTEVVERVASTQEALAGTMAALTEHQTRAGGEPAPPEPDEIDAEPEVVDAEPEVVGAQPEVVVAQPENVDAEPDTIVAEPDDVVAQLLDAVAHLQDAVAQLEDVIPEPDEVIPDVATPDTGEAAGPPKLTLVGLKLPPGAVTPPAVAPPAPRLQLIGLKAPDAPWGSSPWASGSSQLRTSWNALRSRAEAPGTVESLPVRRDRQSGATPAVAQRGHAAWYDSTMRVRVVMTPASAVPVSAAAPPVVVSPRTIVTSAASRHSPTT